MEPFFKPPFGLRNPHVQTIFSSIGPRRTKVKKAFHKFHKQQQEVTLNCHDGIRLGGFLNQATATKSKQLAILIHGWEGSAESSYILSTTTQLLDQCIDVFRLNLRDHGGTHHLNRGIFNSTLIDEVISGLEDLQQRYSYPSYSLIGYSLGGNFSLRVVANAQNNNVHLDRVIVFCPVIHAYTSNVALNRAHNYLYGQYFVRKWKRSLYNKLTAFPDYDYEASLAGMKTLDQMNEELIPKYTRFKDVNDYFDAYAVTGDTLVNTICPCYLHFAKDDMIIPHDDIKKLADNPKLDITVTEWGGHCGFLMNWKLESWQDKRVVELLTT